MAPHERAQFFLGFAGSGGSSWAAFASGRATSRELLGRPVTSAPPPPRFAAELVTLPTRARRAANPGELVTPPPSHAAAPSLADREPGDRGKELAENAVGAASQLKLLGTNPANVDPVPSSSASKNNIGDFNLTKEVSMAIHVAW
jgi:hypothetical protein